MSHEGGCLCGAVRYRTSGPLRGVVNCHCSQCRKTHGHFGAYTDVDKDSFELTEQRGLGWYYATPGNGRGFCRECGATLFWNKESAPVISIAAGTLDGRTGLATVANIFAGSKGDYYEITDGLPCYAEGMPV